MRHHTPSLPGPDELTPEEIIELRELDDRQARRIGAPLNLQDLCDIALGHRFHPAERRAARYELAQLYELLCSPSLPQHLPVPAE